MKKFYIAKARRLRGTPYSSRIESQGLTAYTTYNHMLLPASFESTEKDYFHLKEHVQIWDVAAQRQVSDNRQRFCKINSADDLQKSFKGKSGQMLLCTFN